MNSKERFYACICYERPDRPPIAPLHGQPYVLDALYKYFNVKSHEEFELKVGEDFRSVNPIYIGPKLKTYDDGSYDGIWGERYKRIPFANGTYEEPIFLPFKDVYNIDEIKKFRFPTADFYDYSTIKAKCEQYKDYAIITGNAGILDFMNGIGFARGVEQVYIDVGLEDEVFLYIMEKRYSFHYEMMKRTLEAAGGLIDVVYCGEDLGTQMGPIINPAKFTKLFAPKYKEFFEMVHSYGARTMMHSCGGIRPFIPILIDIGLDILDVVQVDAANMDLEQLHKDFNKKIVFCRSLSVQSLLPKGTPEQITKEIDFRKELFKDGGIILGPTNAMQSDMPIENFVAMCKAIGCLD